MALAFAYPSLPSTSGAPMAAPRAGAAPLMQTNNLFSSRGFFIRAAAVGNAGFDPLGLSQALPLESLRQAEIKHGRLAMMGVVGWIAQEYLHPILASGLHARSVLFSEQGLAPTVINGGLNQPELAPALAFGASVMMVSEVLDIRKREAKGLGFNQWAAESAAGDVGFDPLKITANMPATERFELQEAEMLNGRLAMLAFVAIVMFESMSSVPVIHADWHFLG